MAKELRTASDFTSAEREAAQALANRLREAWSRVTPEQRERYAAKVQEVFGKQT